MSEDLTEAEMKILRGVLNEYDPSETGFGLRSGKETAKILSCLW